MWLPPMEAPCSTTPLTSKRTSTQVPPQEAQEGESVVLELHDETSIHYWGAFDWEGAELREGRYLFETERGFRFRIDHFKVAAATIQLRPCEVDAPETASFLGVRLGIPAAHADHVASDDPSRVVVDLAEDAFETLDELAVGTAPAGLYCEAFLLASVLTTVSSDGQNGDGDGEPDAAFALGVNTLAFAGAFQPISADPKSESWTSIEARIPLSEGMLEPLQTPPTTLNWPLYAQGDSEVDVIVTRYPVRAFQDLNPLLALPYELAWDALGTLLHSSSVHVLPR